MKNKKKISILGAVILLSIFVAQSSLAQGGNGSGMQGQGKNMVDNNGNGIADGQEDVDNDGIVNRDDSDYVKTSVNMRDADADGVANKIDTDYAPAQDGTGRQAMAQGQQGQGANGSGSGIVNSEAGQGAGQGMQQNQNNPAQTMNRNNNQYNNSEVGNRVRMMNQDQVKNQSIIQEKIQLAGKRNGVTKFFAGPDYGALSDANQRLVQHEENIIKLQAISDQTIDSNDKALIEEQIKNMEQVSAQLRSAIDENEQGFSLFGWAFKLFN